MLPVAAANEPNIWAGRGHCSCGPAERLRAARSQGVNPAPLTWRRHSSPPFGPNTDASDPMASRPQPTASRGSGPRLYLVTPVVAGAPAYASPLAAALGAGDIAAVLLRLAIADERTLINRIKVIAPAVQE